MKKYFVQIENNKVTRTTPFECEDNQVAINWLNANAGGNWIFGCNADAKRTVGCNWDYHPETGGFSSPKMYASWTLDKNYEWQPPVPKPSDYYWWDESSLSWVPIPNAG